MAQSRLESYWVDDLQLTEDEQLWHQLANTQPHPIFYTLNWFKACLNWLPKHASVKCWVARDESIKAIIPLLFVKQKTKGITHVSIEWLRVPDSQFCGIICNPDYLQAVIHMFIDDLEQQKQHWDVLNLYPVDSSTKEFFTDMSRAVIEPASYHYFLSIDDTWEAYYAGKSRRLKKSNNHLANRLKAQGDLEIEKVTDFSKYSIQEIMDMITFISERSWKAKTNTTLNHSGPSSFLKSLTQSAATDGNLIIWLLRLDKKVIAYEYQLHSQGNIYALRSDFDEQYRDLSPGSFLNWKILEQIFTGNSTYYMGPGVNAYKTRWKNGELPLYRIKAYAKTFKGRLLYSINENLFPMMRHTKKQEHLEDLK